jgi:chromosome segregation ATPase
VEEELKHTRQKLAATETMYSSIQHALKLSEEKYATEMAAEKAKHQSDKDMLHEYTESLEELQSRFEVKSKQYLTLRAENEDLQATLATSVSQSKRHSAEIATLNEKYASLEAELKESRAALLNSAEPSVAERESFHAEIRALKESNATLEKKVANLNHDLEYCREQYQTASNAAVEATNRLSEISAELTMAQRKASGEAVKLATLNRNNENRDLRDEVQKLRLEVKIRDDLLRRKEEELRDLNHGRAGYVTRGNSVGGKSSRGASPGLGAGGHGGGKVGGSSLRFG